MHDINLCILVADPSHDVQSMRVRRAIQLKLQMVNFRFRACEHVLASHIFSSSRSVSRLWAKFKVLDLDFGQRCPASLPNNRFHRSFTHWATARLSLICSCLTAQEALLRISCQVQLQKLQKRKQE